MPLGGLISPFFLAYGSIDLFYWKEIHLISTGFKPIVCKINKCLVVLEDK